VGRNSPQATGAATDATNNSRALTSNANGIYSSLVPQLETEAANPQGFNPTQLATMNTAAQETAGGATAGATGRGALLAGRTRNAGTAAKAISDAARTGGQQLSTAEQGIQNENASLKEHERQAGLSGLQGIYGTDVSGANSALGQVAPLVNANTGVENASWNWLKPVEALGGLANAGASAYKTYSGGH
jgi:hypothetical protein